MRVPNTLFEMRDFSYLKLGNRALKAKIRARLGIESVRRRWDAKKTIGITGLVDILGWDYGMEDPIEDPHLYTALNLFYT